MFILSVFLFNSLFYADPSYASDELGLLSSTPNNTKYAINDFPMFSDLTFTSDIEKSSLKISLYKEVSIQDSKNLSNIISYNEKKYNYLYELKKTVTNASYLSNFIIPELISGKYLILWEVNQCIEACLLLSNDSATRIAAAEAFAKQGKVFFEVSDFGKKNKLDNKYLLFISITLLLLLIFWLIKKITPNN